MRSFLSLKQKQGPHPSVSTSRVVSGISYWRRPFVLGLTALSFACAGASSSGKARSKVQAEKVASIPLGNELEFQGACASGAHVTIAAVGDVLPHPELQKQAFANEEERFRNIWSGVEDLLAVADITYANLEGPMATGITRDGKVLPDPGFHYDGKVFTGFPEFNYHPQLAYDLKSSGVDVVSTANNHSMDRGEIGADLTIDVLRQVGLPYTGTRKQSEPDAPWHVVTEANGISVAWLACTKHTNDRPDPKKQTLHCFRDQTEVEALIGTLSKAPDIDAVVVTPHWGEEYNHSPREKEIDLAHRFLEAGATALIGSHPHVLQPWERYITRDGRETFAIYSMGNFASHQWRLPRRSSIILYFGLTKPENGKTVITGVRYVPTHVRKDGERFFVEAVDRAGGPAKVRNVVTKVMGKANLIPPNLPVTTKPNCAQQANAS